MNKGFSPKLEQEQQSDSDWVFGSLSLPCLASVPEDERESYLPKGELQKGVEDFMDCGTRAALNILECKFNFLLGIKPKK